MVKRVRNQLENSAGWEGLRLDPKSDGGGFGGVLFFFFFFGNAMRLVGF